MCPFLQLVKFHYHVTFLVVVFGALSCRTGSPFALAGSLIVLYLLFNVLLYGGLYTLNDLADIDSDGRHPLKRSRPLPSGAIGVPAALAFAAGSIALGVLGALLCFGADFALIFLAFAVLNGIYSLQARDTPYLDLIVNSATYPLRYLMGAALAGGKASAHQLLAVFAVALGIVCLRRIVEMEAGTPEARPALRHYSRRGLLLFQLLALAALLALCSCDARMSATFVGTALLVYLMFVFGFGLSGGARNLLCGLWNR